MSNPHAYFCCFLTLFLFAGPVVRLNTRADQAGSMLENMVIAEVNGSVLPKNSFKSGNLSNSGSAISYQHTYKNPCWYEEDSKKAFLHCMPYFLVAGFTKSGTTELFQTLKLHPQISPANYKETFWWKRQFLTKAGPVDYTAYFSRATFDILSTVRMSKKQNLPWEHPVVTYEATPDLVYDGLTREKPGEPVKEPQVLLIDNVKKIIPNVKIIVIMREPISRVYSDYMQFSNISLQHFHKETVFAIKDFQDCMARSGMRACAYRDVGDMARKRLRTGLYHIYMKDLLRTFPSEQILYIRLEDYTRNRILWLRKITQFLGLDTLDDEVERRMLELKNPNPQKYRFGTMRNDTYQLWKDFYAPHNEMLADLLNDPAYSWR